jgi:hypothetical protein
MTMSSNVTAPSSARRRRLWYLTLCFRVANRPTQAPGASPARLCGPQSRYRRYRTGIAQRTHDLSSRRLRAQRRWSQKTACRRMFAQCAERDTRHAKWKSFQELRSFDDRPSQYVHVWDSVYCFSKRVVQNEPTRRTAIMAQQRNSDAPGDVL